MIVAFWSGLLFGFGLLISGMVDPARVLGFLRLAPGWDPTLIFVMLGAVLVFGAGYWGVVRRLEKPFQAERFELPAKRTLDLRLLVGAALFGMGWGGAGICPGPALVNLAGGAQPILLFVLAMLVGMAAVKIGQSRTSQG